MSLLFDCMQIGEMKKILVLGMQLLQNVGPQVGTMTIQYSRLNQSHESLVNSTEVCQKG